MHNPSRHGDKWAEEERRETVLKSVNGDENMSEQLMETDNAEVSGEVANAVRDANYYIEHQDEYDALTEDQLTELTINGSVKVDTEAAKAVTDSEETASLADDEEVKKAEEAAKSQEAEVEKVVLTKDGKHTIPFSELEDARNKATTLEQTIAAKDQLIANLQEAAKKDAGTGETNAQDEVLKGLVEDFPELAEKLVPALQKMVEDGVKASVAGLEAKFAETIKPLKETTQDIESERHFNAIGSAHPDFKELFNGNAVDEWVEKQPSFAREAYKQVMEKGSATQVIEMLDAFKAANPVSTVDKKDPPPTKEQVAADAKAKLTEAKPKVPVSLSDIPAGAKAHHDEAEAMLEMDASQLLAKMQDKSPAEIEKLLAKVL